jgi:hypothetical protein
MCHCDCGGFAPIATKTDASTERIKGRPVRYISGHNARVNHPKFKHGMADTPEYAAYLNAKQRCTNPNHSAWENYGGRGIQFRLPPFEQFIAHVGLKPGPEYELDRIDNDGDYEIGNIRWATHAENMTNRRPVSAETRRNISIAAIEWHARKHETEAAA